MKYERKRFEEKIRRRGRGSILDVVSAPSIAHDQREFGSCKALLAEIFLRDCATLICYMVAKFGTPIEIVVTLGLRIDGISGFLVVLHVVWICLSFINMRKIVFPNAPSIVYRRSTSDFSPVVPETEMMAASRHHLLSEGDLTSTRKLNIHP